MPRTVFRAMGALGIACSAAILATGAWMDEFSIASQLGAAAVCAAAVTIAVQWALLRFDPARRA